MPRRSHHVSVPRAAGIFVLGLVAGIAWIGPAREAHAQTYRGA
jgi:hypothetical protein